MFFLNLEYGVPHLHDLFNLTSPALPLCTVTIPFTAILKRSIFFNTADYSSCCNLTVALARTVIQFRLSVLHAFIPIFPSNLIQSLYHISPLSQRLSQATSFIFLQCQPFSLSFYMIISCPVFLFKFSLTIL